MGTKEHIISKIYVFYFFWLATLLLLAAPLTISNFAYVSFRSPFPALFLPLCFSAMIIPAQVLPFQIFFSPS